MSDLQNPSAGRARPADIFARQSTAVLGWTMRKLREAAGWSARRTAREFGCSVSHISRAEHGKSKPSRELVLLYEEHFEGDGMLLSLFDVAEHADGPRVFLSYSDSDADPARLLANALARRGARVWLDENELRAGDDIAQRIDQGLASADIFLVLISQTSVGSPWIQREIGRAASVTTGHSEVRLVPVRLGDVELPPVLGNRLYVDYDPSDVDGLAEAVLGRPREAHGLSEAAFQQRVEQVLHTADVRYDRQVSVGGIVADFVVETQDGRTLVLEAKATRDPGLAEAVRARDQARRIQELTGADGAFTVFAGFEGSADLGVVGLAQLAEVLGAEQPETAPTRRVERRRRVAPTRTIFAAMPFAREYEDVFWIAMAGAAAAVGAGCTRVDEEEFTGDVVDEIQRLIHFSMLVIADLSESKPNVLYEVGYAHALKKPTVHICSTSLDDLPFDVRNWNTVVYGQGQTHRLRTDLTRRVKKILGSAGH